MSDDEIETRATASVAETVKGARVRPAIEAALPKDRYRNPDGTVNATQLAEAITSGSDPDVASLKITDVFENIPADYDRRKAAEVQKLKRSQGGLRKQYDRFMSIINNRRPAPGGEAMSLDEVTQAFQTILQNGKPEDLEEFYRLIQKVNIN